MPLLNQYEIEKYIKIAADRGDLKVVWEDKDLPRTDGKTVWLPKLTMNTTEEGAKRLMWMTTHEASHSLYTDFSLLKEKSLDVTKSELAGLFNQLEDDNIDYINGTQFRGDRELCAEQANKMLSSLVDKAKKAKAEGRDKEMGQKWDNLMTMMAFEADIRSDYCYGTSHLVDEFKDLINNKSETKVDKLLSGPYKEELRKLREDHTMGRSRKTYELAKKIFEEILNGDAAKEEERLKQLAKESKGSEDGDGKGAGKGKAKKGKGDKGEDGEGSPEAGDGGDDTSNVEAWLDYEQWSSDPAAFIKHEKVGAGEHISYDRYKMEDGRDYVPCPYRDTYVIDYDKNSTNYSRINPKESTGEAFTRRYRDEHVEVNSDGFANRVRMLLQIRAKGRTQYGTKKGTLHPANLYRTTVKDAPGYNERVFKKRIVSDVLDTCVQIMVDGSGSMMGTKYSHAMTAAVHLSDTLGNVLHMPVEILGFTEFEARDVIFVYRGFDTKVLSKDKLLYRMIHGGQYANQNADGDSVLFGYSRIIQRKEKRKVMIVLSDGSPAGDRRGDLPGFTKQVVQGIEKQKKVEIIGIGVMDNNVKRFYKENQVIHTPKEIEPALLKLIQRKIV